MAKDPNSPKVVRDETLRLATTHLAETAIGRARNQISKEIREISFTIAATPVMALLLAFMYSITDQIWIGIGGLLVICAAPALGVLLLFKLNDIRGLNNRLIAEYELRRKYKRV